MSSPQESFLAGLTRAGYLSVTGVQGVYASGAKLESLIDGIHRHIGRIVPKPDAIELVACPPVMSRADLARGGYLDHFPHLAGLVGGTRAADGRSDATESLRRDAESEGDSIGTELALTPAACHPIYPILATRGSVPRAGAVIDTGPTYVFRREPSQDPMRLQAFRQREFVFVASTTQVTAWCDAWCELAADRIRDLGLEAQGTPASDPFFGRAGRLLAATQRELSRKHEIRVALWDSDVAVASVNHHGTHFAGAFGLFVEDGHMAETACVGFGYERIALALLAVHGVDRTTWPVDVEKVLARRPPCPARSVS